MAGTGKSLRVLPDAARVEEAMVEAAREGGFVDGSAFRTFGQLLDALGGARALRRRPCPPLTARAVVWAAAKKLGPGPFGAFVHEPAFARAALELFGELKAGGLAPDAFRASVDRFPASRLERAHYLARLFEAYEAQLHALGLADREDEVQGALAALSGGGLPPGLRELERISLQGLTDFPLSRQRLLLALAGACEASKVAFELSVPAGCSPDVDGAVDPLLSRFEREAQQWVHVEVAKEDLTTRGRPLAALGRRFFSSAAEPEPAPGLALLRAATCRHEVEALARIVAEKVEAGIAPERICVAWPDLGEEAEAVVEALEALGIPARLRRGAPLVATPAGRAALDLPRVVDDGFGAEDVARLLSSRYFPAVSEGAPSSPATLLRLASVRDDRLGAEGERGAYEVRLGALLARLEERSKGGGRAGQVRALLQRTRRLLSVAGQLPAEGKAQELLDRWWHAVEELGLFKAVRQPEPRGAEGTALGRAVLRALARDQAASESLHALFQALRTALKDSGAGSTRMPRRVFHRWLLDAARDFNLSPRGPRGGAVNVLDVRELGGRTFDHVCLGGFTDGRFPGRTSPHPLFPEEDRARVNSFHGRDVFRLHTGEGERRIGWRLAHDRLVLHLALCASRGTVTVSHAHEAPGGAEQNPSPFWDELCRLTGAVPRPLPLRAVTPLDEVRTEDELRERAALELFATVGLRTSEPDPAGAALRRRLSDEPWAVTAGEWARIEEERLRFFGDEEAAPGPYSGDAAAPGLEDALARCFALGPDRPISASSLQRFGNCAFQGFLAFALRLEEPEEPGEEMDARGQGSYWHKVLELLFPLLEEEGLLDAPPEDVPDAVVDRALDAAAREVERTGHTGHPALWKLGREKARGMVRRVLLSTRRGLPFDFMRPKEAELRFGRPDAKPGWERVAIPSPSGGPPVHVEGKIDRLDEGNGALGVVDYKSGSVKTGKAFWDSFLVTQFQLPLYLFAARAAGHEGPLRAAWIPLKDGEPVLLDDLLRTHGLEVDDLLSTDPEVCARLEKEGLKTLASAVHALVAGLRQGRFPARPEDCGLCPYQRVCRISERRLPEGGAA